MVNPYATNGTMTCHRADKLQRWSLSLMAFKYVIEHVPEEFLPLRCHPPRRLGCHAPSPPRPRLAPSSPRPRRLPRRHASRATSAVKLLAGALFSGGALFAPARTAAGRRQLLAASCARWNSSAAASTVLLVHLALGDAEVQANDEAVGRLNRRAAQIERDPEKMAQ
ncbi:hypothetical protein PR003_g27538 [Phytophthora rubi]|uniref:Uncharacterized protein n=1 Tax=Phytophthora rubi TaxID=129364 RepID=A0A6A4C2P8_9STRA|nr:hypothetical protein PR003_g27538 [Phytophthora rubi]